MLPKKERLTKKDFSRFFSMGKKTHTPHMIVVHTPSQGLHCAVSVSKKVHKTAVKRNKLRRQMYDMVRRYHKTHNLTGVYIIVLKPSIAGLTRDEVQDTLIPILQKFNT